MNFRTEVAAKGVRERDFVVTRGDRSIPGVLWTAAEDDQPRPVVMLGHGASGSKREDYIVALARGLVRHQGLSAFAERGRQLGFRGMVAIHPTHVAVINNVFSPSDQQISFYRGMVEAYERAMAAGDGAIRFQNLHIDQAHYDKARKWLAERGVAQ